MESRKVSISMSEWEKVDEVIGNINNMEGVAALPIDGFSFYFVVSSDGSMEEITELLNTTFNEVEITEKF